LHTKQWHMSQVQTGVIQVWFSTLPAQLLFRPGKVVKIRLKKFSAILMRNDKNYSPNSVGMFWSKTESFGPDFQLCLLQACSRGVWARTCRKIWPKYFSAIMTEIDKNCTQTVMVFFGFKTESSRPDFQLCLVGACSGGVWHRKSHQALTKRVFSRIDEKR